MIDTWAQKDGHYAGSLVVSNELYRRDVSEADVLFEAGARLFTLGLDGPDFDYDLVRRWLAWRDAHK